MVEENDLVSIRRHVFRRPMIRQRVPGEFDRNTRYCLTLGQLFILTDTTCLFFLQTPVHLVVLYLCKPTL